MVTWMRRTIGFVLMAFGLLGSGCSLATDATCLAVFTVKETAQDFSESVRNRKWADSAWEEVKHSAPHRAYSEDYACGFKDGFAHYLYRGGNGEPPPLPPEHYRKVRYQTPQGYKAIEDWFAGFRQGAMAARQSGYRYWITGPSALRGPSPVLTLTPPAPEQAHSLPALPIIEIKLADIERPTPVETAPQPVETSRLPVPTMLPPPEPQRPNAPAERAAPPPASARLQPSQPSGLPATLPPAPQPKWPSTQGAPVPPDSQSQRPSTPPALPATMPLPMIINGGAPKRDTTPLPMIFNGSETASRNP